MSEENEKVNTSEVPEATKEETEVSTEDANVQNNEAGDAPDVKVTEGQDKEEEEKEEYLDILGNKTLLKKVVEEGSGGNPSMGERVTIELQKSIPALEKEFPSEEVTFTLGDCDVEQALDLGVALMKLKEKAIIVSGYKYMFGEIGLEPDIPPFANFKLDVLLTANHGYPDYGKMALEERFLEAKKKKERGNFYFRRKDYSQAVFVYTKANKIVDPSEGCVYPDASPEKLQELLEFRGIILANTSVAQLKVGAADAAVKSALEATNLCPSYSKAHFRLGQAYEGKGMLTEAIKAHKAALKHDPENSKEVDFNQIIHNELSRLTKLNKEAKQSEKDMYSKMFWGSKPPNASPNKQKAKDDSSLNGPPPVQQYGLNSANSETSATTHPIMNSEFIFNNQMFEAGLRAGKEKLEAGFSDSNAIELAKSFLEKVSNGALDDPTEMMKMAGLLSSLIPPEVDQYLRQQFDANITTPISEKEHLQAQAATVERLQDLLQGITQSTDGMNDQLDQLSADGSKQDSAKDEEKNNLLTGAEVKEKELPVVADAKEKVEAVVTPSTDSNVVVQEDSQTKYQPSASDVTDSKKVAAEIDVASLVEKKIKTVDAFDGGEGASHKEIDEIYKKESFQSQEFADPSANKAVTDIPVAPPTPSLASYENVAPTAPDAVQEISQIDNSPRKKDVTDMKKNADAESYQSQEVASSSADTVASSTDVSVACATPSFSLSENVVSSSSEEDQEMSEIDTSPIIRDVNYVRKIVAAVNASSGSTRDAAQALNAYYKSHNAGHKEVDAYVASKELYKSQKVNVPSAEKASSSASAFFSGDIKIGVVDSDSDDPGESSSYAKIAAAKPTQNASPQDDSSAESIENSTAYIRNPSQINPEIAAVRPTQNTIDPDASLAQAIRNPTANVRCPFQISPEIAAVKPTQNAFQPDVNSAEVVGNPGVNARKLYHINPEVATVQPSQNALSPDVSSTEVQGNSTADIRRRSLGPVEFRIDEESMNASLNTARSARFPAQRRLDEQMEMNQIYARTYYHSWSTNVDNGNTYAELMIDGDDVEDLEEMLEPKSRPVKDLMEIYREQQSKKKYSWLTNPLFLGTVGAGLAGMGLGLYRYFNSN